MGLVKMMMTNENTSITRFFVKNQCYCHLLCAFQKSGWGRQPASRTGTQHPISITSEAARFDVLQSSLGMTRVIAIPSGYRRPASLSIPCRNLILAQMDYPLWAPRATAARGTPRPAAPGCSPRDSITLLSVDDGDVDGAFVVDGDLRFLTLSLRLVFRLGSRPGCEFRAPPGVKGK